MSLEVLPDELLLEILEKMDIAGLGSLANSSSKYSNLIYDDNLWKTIFIRDFGIKELPKGDTWKFYYQKYQLIAILNSYVDELYNSNIHRFMNIEKDFSLNIDRFMTECSNIIYVLTQHFNLNQNLEDKKQLLSILNDVITITLNENLFLYDEIYDLIGATLNSLIEDVTRFIPHLNQIKNQYMKFWPTEGYDIAIEKDRISALNIKYNTLLIKQYLKYIDLKV